MLNRELGVWFVLLNNSDNISLICSIWSTTVIRWIYEISALYILYLIQTSKLRNNTFMCKILYSYDFVRIL